MPFGGQIGPESAFFELGSHWGQRCAVLTGRGGAFRRPISLVRPRGSHFSGTSVPCGSFCSVSRAASCREKIGPFLLRPRHKTDSTAGKKKQKQSSCEKEITSEASGVCLLRPASARSRALDRKPPPRERDARNQRDEPPTATKWRMSTHLFLAITLMAVSGADKHLWRTRPPGPLSGAHATDAPPQGHAGDTRC